MKKIDLEHIETVLRAGWLVAREELLAVESNNRLLQR
jgi:hypothetical protein